MSIYKEICHFGSKRMSISVLTFADFGTRCNLKTRSIRPLITTLEDVQMLDLVICRLAPNEKRTYIRAALHALEHVTIMGWGKIYKRFNARRVEEELFDAHAAKIIKKHCESDILIFHPGRFPRALRAARQKGIICIGVGTTAHPAYSQNLRREELQRMGVEEELQDNPIKGMDVANDFDYFIALSPYVKKTYSVSGYPEENIFVASLDVDAEKFNLLQKKEQKPDEFIVVYPAASSDVLRGLQYLLEAWTMFSAPNKKLIILGRVEGLVWEAYKDVLLNDASIKTIGFTATPEEYLRKASVVVLPSLTEGFPKTVIEAMACGVPVITTEHAPSIIEDGVSGFIVPIRDAHAIHTKLELLYNNPHKADAIGEAARVAVEKKKPFGKAVLEICEKVGEQVRTI